MRWFGWLRKAPTAATAETAAAAVVAETRPFFSMSRRVGAAWRHSKEAFVGTAGSGAAMTGGILGATKKFFGGIVGAAVLPIEGTARVVKRFPGTSGFIAVSAALIAVGAFLGHRRHQSREDREMLEADKAMALSSAKKAGFRDEMAHFHDQVLNPDARSDNVARLQAREAEAVQGQSSGRTA